MTSPRHFIRTLALVIVLAPALATTSAAAGRSIGQIIDDTTITAEIKAKLTADKLSNLTKIDVKSEAGVVTLGGTVDSAATIGFTGRPDAIGWPSSSRSIETARYGPGLPLSLVRT